MKNNKTVYLIYQATIWVTFKQLAHLKMIINYFKHSHFYQMDKEKSNYKTINEAS